MNAWRTLAQARAAATVFLLGRPPHGPHARAVGELDLSCHLEAMAERQALVALTRRLEVRGHRVSIEQLEHGSQQGRADAPGLPLGSGAEQEEVVMRLAGVCVVHALEDLEECLRVGARDLS